MGEWDLTPLPEVLQFREGPGIMAADFRDEGVPLIRLAGLKDGADIFSKCNFLDPARVEEKWEHFKLLPGDVLLSTSASLGEVSTVPARAAGAIPYTGIVSFRPKNDRVHRSYVRHMLTDPAFESQIREMGVGSVMTHFGPSHLRQMTVRFPSVANQIAIAEVLGAFDDKIAANARMIPTCESLAAELWRTSGKSAAVALSSLATFVNGRAYTKGASGTGRVVVRIAELNSGIGASTVRNDIEVSENNTARPGDLLFAWSGSLTVARWYRPEAIINQHIFKVIPVDDYPMWFVHQALKTKLADFRATASDKATTMGHIQRHHLDEVVHVPTIEEVGRIGQQMQGCWDLALATEIENLHLARTRDEILPLLMSGQMTVKDAESRASDVL
ncbi:restriction endonuclease subunit S [Rhodococcus sp. BP-149]|uniref:restriction endonuclease subunit S n=1 Tax=unclassified Rhodococcus (in: high G+C Gram-positive bacteria) TaxID=192944 RepID=UPI001C9A6C8F|nr:MULTISPECIES: restriction endonuclease subunit S [unclassified Rhodococcus (in: high G+C Gram-positive bacteria)]MBY6685142.1 restriction endonuclease subunit S [Rhodococcus sp. BP-288]MBY6692374.1 restriction endonuclease subunit S [Rhodococcus sp. BP-188]MBY6698272.1 restriction endonuclease subunit S [Rhodococcus sp. BP-285]MBY6700952.1 restriction endonuclease subunit S [Rhodococcus sp. BP-283]MBY6711952.1 restriction endonuclease subunit S [Rhodococcus sp. BP-160]